MRNLIIAKSKGNSNKLYKDLQYGREGRIKKTAVRINAYGGYKYLINYYSTGITFIP